MLGADDELQRTTPFLKSLGLISRPESAALTRDSFDPDLTNCSIDAVADSEAGVSQKAEHTKVSAALTSASIDPVLTICNLPPDLITESPDLIKKRRKIHQQKCAQLRAKYLKAKAPQRCPQSLCKKKIQDYRHLLNLGATECSASRENSHKDTNTLKTERSQQETKLSNEKNRQNTTQPAAKQTSQNRPHFVIQNLSTTEITQRHPHTTQLLNQVSASSQRSAILMNKEKPQIISQAIIKGPFQGRPQFLIQNLNLNTTHLLATQITGNCPPLLAEISFHKDAEKLKLNNNNAQEETPPENKEPLYMRLKYLSKNKLLTRMQLTRPELAQDNTSYYEVPPIESFSSETFQIRPKLLINNNKPTLIQLPSTDKDNSRNKSGILKTEDVQYATFLGKESSRNKTQVLKKETHSKQPLSSNINISMNQPEVSNTEVLQSQDVVSIENAHSETHILNTNASENETTESHPTFLIQNTLLNSTQLLTTEITQNHPQLLTEVSTHNDLRILNIETSQSGEIFFNNENTDVMTPMLTQTIEASQGQPQYKIQKKFLDRATHLLASKLTQNHPLSLNEASSHKEQHVSDLEFSHHSGDFVNEENEHNVTLSTTQDGSQNQPQFVIQNLDPTGLLASKLTQNHQQLLNEAFPHKESDIFNIETSHHAGKLMNKENQQNVTGPITQDISQNEPQFIIQNQSLDSTHLLASKLTQNVNEVIPHEKSHIFNIETAHPIGKQFSEEIQQDVAIPVTQDVSQSRSHFVIQNQLEDSMHLLTSKLTQKHKQPSNETNSHNESHIFSIESAQSLGKCLIPENPQNIMQPMIQGNFQSQPQFDFQSQSLDHAHLLNSKITQNHQQLLNNASSHNESHIFNVEIPQNVTQSATLEDSRVQEQFGVQNGSLDPTNLVASKLIQNHTRQLLNEANLLKESRIFNLASHGGGKILIEDDAQNVTQSITQEVSQYQPQFVTHNQLLDPPHLVASKVTQSHPQLLDEVRSRNEIAMFHTGAAQGGGKYFNDVNSENVMQSVIQESDQNQSECVIQNDLFESTHLLASKMIQSHRQLVEEINSLNDDHVFSVESAHIGGKFLNEENPLNLTQSITKENIQNKSQFGSQNEFQDSTHLLNSTIAQSHPQVLNEENLHSDVHIFDIQASQQSGHFLSDSYPLNLSQSIIKETSQTQSQFFNKNELKDTTHLLAAKIIQSHSQLLNKESTHDNENILNPKAFQGDGKVLNESSSQIIADGASQCEIQCQLLEPTYPLASKVIQGYPQMSTQVSSHSKTRTLGADASQNGEKCLNESNHHNLPHPIIEGVSKSQSQFLIQNQIPSSLTTKINENQKLPLLNKVKDVKTLNKTILYNECPLNEPKVMNVNPSQSNLNNIELVKRTHILGAGVSPDCLIILKKGRSPNVQHILTTHGLQSGAQLLSKESSQNDTPLNKETLRHRPPGLIKKKLHSRVTILATDFLEDSTRDSKTQDASADTKILAKSPSKNVEQSKEKRLLDNTLTSERHKQYSNKKKKRKSHLNLDDSQHRPQCSNKDFNTREEKKKSSQHSSQVITKSVLLRKECSLHKADDLNTKPSQTGKTVHSNLLSFDIMASNTSQILHKENAQIGTCISNKEDAQILEVKSLKDETQVQARAIIQSTSQYLSDLISRKDSPIQDNRVSQINKQLLNKNVQPIILYNTRIPRPDEPSHSTENFTNVTQLPNKEVLQGLIDMNRETLECNDQSLNEEILQNVDDLQSTEISQGQREGFKDTHSDHEIQLLNTKALQTGLQFLNHDYSQNVCQSFDTDSSPLNPKLIDDESSQNAIHPHTKDPQLLNNEKSQSEVVLPTTDTESSCKHKTKDILQLAMERVNFDNLKCSPFIINRDDSVHYADLLSPRETVKPFKYKDQVKSQQARKYAKLDYSKIRPPNPGNNDTDKTSKGQESKNKLEQAVKRKVEADASKYSSLYSDSLNSDKSVKYSQSEIKSKSQQAMKQMQPSILNHPKCKNKVKSQEAVKRKKTNVSKCISLNCDDFNLNKAERLKSENKDDSQPSMKRPKINASKCSTSESNKMTEAVIHAISENKDESEKAIKRIKTGVSESSLSNTYDESLVQNKKLMMTPDDTVICSIFKNKDVTIKPIKRIQIDTSKCGPTNSDGNSLINIVTPEEISISVNLATDDGKTVPDHSKPIDKTSEPQPCTSKSTSPLTFEIGKTKQNKSESVKFTSKTVKATSKAAKSITKTVKTTSKTAESTPKTVESMSNTAKSPPKTVKTTSKATESTSHIAQSMTNAGQSTTKTTQSTIKTRQSSTKTNEFKNTNNAKKSTDAKKSTTAKKAMNAQKSTNVKKSLKNNKNTTPKIEVVMDESTIIDSQDAKLKTSKDLDCHFFKTNLGRRILVINKIRYRVNCYSQDKVRWRCTTHERFGCKARVHTCENKIVYLYDHHMTEAPGLDKILGTTKT